jgi:alpha-galactosidase
LTIGYGTADRTGVELEFGTVVGDALQEPVLLIKTAWGGHSLFKSFRSPSSGLPSKAALEQELEQARDRVRKRNAKGGAPQPLPTIADIESEYGVSYRRMLREVRTTLEECATLFPALAGRRPDLAGFVWFQGWNDQYGAEDEYRDNMERFIRDVRADLDAPRLPFVIGVMGQNGSTPAKGAMKTIQDAQLAMESVRDFAGNVRAVRTDELVDKAAEALYPEWRERVAEWDKVGGDHPYHYFGSPLWFGRIGKSFGAAMLGMIGARD